MAEPAPSLLALILRKVSAFARERQLVSKAADWLGLTQDEYSAEAAVKEEYEEEDSTLKKWSYSWFAHRLKPANKYFWGIFGVILLARLLGLMNYLPELVCGAAAVIGLFFSLWLFLRWVSRRVEPQTSELAFKLRVQARGIFWWSWVLMGSQFLTQLVSTVFDLIF